MKIPQTEQLNGSERVANTNSQQDEHKKKHVELSFSTFTSTENAVATGVLTSVYSVWQLINKNGQFI